MKWMRRIRLYAITIIAGVLACASEPQGAPRDDMPITTRSEEARRLYQEGTRYIDSWQLEKARPLFERALELDADFPLAVVGLSWSQPRFKEMFELGTDAREMLARVDVSDAERLYVEGFYASLNSDTATWVDNARTVAEMYPGGTRAQLGYGIALMFGSMDYAAARAQFEKTARTDPEFGPVHSFLGGAHEMLGDDAKAERSYLRYIELAPHDPKAHDDYAEHLLKGGRYEPAVDAFRDALDRDPMYESAHMGIATALMLQGKHDAARKHLMRFYDEAPNDGIRSGLHFALAVVDVDEGRAHDAIHQLEENYRLSEKIGDSVAMRIDLNNTAAVVLEEGFYDDARQKFEQSLELVLSSDQSERRKEATRAMHQYWLGTVAAEEGDTADALKLAASFEAQIAPFQNAFYRQRIHDLRGRIALADGAYQTAIDEFLEADSGDAYTMYRMAKAFDGLGNRDKVAEMLRYVVDYRGVLNLNYAFVRRDAEEWLESIESSRTQDRNVVQARLEEYMGYFVRDGGRWLAENPTYEAGGHAPKHIGYEYRWDFDRSVVRNTIFGVLEDGGRRAFAEAVFAWNPRVGKVEQFLFGVGGGIGRGFENHRGNGVIEADFVWEPLEGEEVQMRDRVEITSPDTFDNATFTKSKNGEWQLRENSELKFERVR